LVEIPEFGVLVCKGCAVQQETRMVCVGTTWENENTTHQEADDAMDPVMKFIENICSKLELDESVMAHAKKELRFFYKVHLAKLKGQRECRLN
jgi:transcription initiation factor TFIIIB Brf1 subunit/transcription initiation factor TFIIB